MENNQKLTVKEALEQGYDKCGYDGTDFQHLMTISELNQEDFENNYRGKIVIASNEPNYVTIDKSEIMDFLTDRYFDESPDDDLADITACFDEETEKIERFVNEINDIFRKKEWFYLTSIELIP